MCGLQNCPHIHVQNLLNQLTDNGSLVDEDLQTPTFSVCPVLSWVFLECFCTVSSFIMDVFSLCYFSFAVYVTHCVGLVVSTLMY